MTIGSRFLWVTISTAGLLLLAANLLPADDEAERPSTKKSSRKRPRVVKVDDSESSSGPTVGPTKKDAPAPKKKPQPSADKEPGKDSGSTESKDSTDSERGGEKAAALPPPNENTAAKPAASGTSADRKQPATVRSTRKPGPQIRTERTGDPAPILTAEEFAKQQSAKRGAGTPPNSPPRSDSPLPAAADVRRAERKPAAPVVIGPGENPPPGKQAPAPIVQPGDVTKLPGLKPTPKRPVARGPERPRTVRPQPLETQSSRKGAPRVVKPTIVEKPQRGSPDNVPKDQPSIARADAEPVVGSRDRWIDAVVVTDVHASSFQGVTPGLTTVAMLADALGAGEVVTGQQRKYSIGPFPNVVVSLRDGRVAQITIDLAEPLPLDQVVEELALADCAATPYAAGLAFPERGIVVSQTKPDSDDVTRIELGLVRAEHFIARATRSWRAGQFQNAIGDADFAANFDPRNAAAQTTLARCWSAIGRTRLALEAIEAARQVDADQPDAQTQHAQILLDLGHRDEAREIVIGLVERDDLPPATLARLRYLQGQLLVHTTNRDHQAAYELHQQAIEIAATLVKDDDERIRLAAKQVLLDAHLAVAFDISWGDWLRKADVAPKWVEIANKIAKSITTRDHGGPIVQLKTERRALAAYGGLRAAIEVDKFVAEVRERVTAQTAAATDPLHRQQLEWEFGQVLYYAARIEQSKKNYDASLKLTEESVALLAAAAKDRQLTEIQNYHLGRTEFLAGTLYALGKRQHKQAQPWFDKALQHIPANPSDSLRLQFGAIGDRYVSMAVTYWQNGERQRAVELTERGARALRRSVGVGGRPEEAMAIPYSNLAAMHRALGNNNKATSYVELAERVRARAARTAAQPSDRR
ncbi:MAG: hypothetical protein QGG36_21980 [Pirellulaceae bacterium]|jgi:tetratricopeptide (TPR) repeat protein|nr:hypothetical protein [Pirellulaceae bacterium]MDP7018490.1 hypothetical protein [Pirellulaceae bacterium]